jgi:hypothetical protein
MWTTILLWLAICAAFTAGFLLAAMFSTSKQGDRAAECAACEQRLVGALTANDHVWLAEEPRRLEVRA